MVRGAGWRLGRVEVAEVAPGQRCGDDDQQRGQDPVEGRLADAAGTPLAAWQPHGVLGMNSGRRGLIG